MHVTWNEIEVFLRNKGMPEDHIQDAHNVYKSPIMQDRIAHSFGIITELTFGRNEDRIAIGAIKDLSELDSCDLPLYLTKHDIDHKQASSVKASQILHLGESEKEKITKALTDFPEKTDDIVYLFSPLLHTGFPHRTIKKGSQHQERVNGKLTVTMSAPNEVGLPAGIYPRILFVYLCSQVVKKRQRKLYLGDSLKGFVKNRLKKPWTTGKRGTGKNWEKNLLSLLATSFTASWASEEGGKVDCVRNCSIVDAATLWWDNSYNHSLGAEIVISETFFNALVLNNNAIPLDFKALSRLFQTTNSPFAFDLFCWLSYKYRQMIVENKSVIRIPWKSLYRQMGSEIKSEKLFVVHARKTLQVVKSSAYPGANFDSADSEYLLLFTSPVLVRSEEKTIQIEQAC